MTELFGHIPPNTVMAAGTVLRRKETDDGFEAVIPSTGTPGATSWGNIGGTLSAQTDLNNALAAKAASAHAHAPAEVTGTAVVTNDARLSDARLPLAHTHTEANVTNLVADLATKAPLVSPSFTTPNIGVATGTSLAATGAITSSGAGIGYVAGAGGAVTQLSARTTGVTLNKLCGNITMFSAAQAAAAVVAFTLTNSFIAANDMVIVTHISATNAGCWAFSCVAGAGSCQINIKNISAASITSATPLRFIVLKAAIA